MRKINLVLLVLAAFFLVGCMDVVTEVSLSELQSIAADQEGLLFSTALFGFEQDEEMDEETMSLFMEELFGEDEDMVQISQNGRQFFGTEVPFIVANQAQFESLEVMEEIALSVKETEGGVLLSLLLVREDDSDDWDWDDDDWDWDDDDWDWDDDDWDWDDDDWDWDDDDWDWDDDDWDWGDDDWDWDDDEDDLPLNFYLNLVNDLGRPVTIFVSNAYVNTEEEPFSGDLVLKEGEELGLGLFDLMNDSYFEEDFRPIALIKK